MANKVVVISKDFPVVVGEGVGICFVIPRAKVSPPNVKPDYDFFFFEKFACPTT
jgi:hypothetical protein